MLALCTPRPLLIPLNTMYLDHATQHDLLRFLSVCQGGNAFSLGKKQTNKTKYKPIIRSNKSIALLMIREFEHQPLAQFA